MTISAAITITVGTRSKRRIGNACRSGIASSHIQTPTLRPVRRARKAIRASPARSTSAIRTTNEGWYMAPNREIPKRGMSSRKAAPGGYCHVSSIGMMCWWARISDQSRYWSVSW